MSKTGQGEGLLRVENGHGPLHDEYMTSNGDHDFTAQQHGPPHRRFWITRDPPMTSNTQVRGWAFGYDEMRDGEWETGWDTWEEWFFEILRYPAQHSSENLVWRRAITGEVVDLAALQVEYDGREIGPHETPASAGQRP